MSIRQTLATGLLCLAAAACVAEPADDQSEDVGEAASAFCGDTWDNSEATAIYLGSFSACDGGSEFLQGAVVKGDIDFYRYRLEDAPFCVPEARVLFDATSQETVCQYFDCVNGDASFACPGGSTPAISPGGRGGCCRTGPGFFEVDLGCSGSASDDVDVYLRFSSSSLSCHGYEAEFDD
jgi:hypothetical protein